MKTWFRCPLLWVLICLLAASASAQGEKPHWKFLQVKHFTAQSGVAVTAEDFDFFYRAIIEKMQKSDLAEQVVDDAATVPPDAAADSVVLEGVVTYFDPGHAFHAGGLSATFNLYRVSDRRLLMTKLWQVASLATAHAKAFGIAGNMAAGQIIKPARELKPLATFPPAPPEQAPPVTVTATSQASASVEVLSNASIVEMVTAKIPEDVILTKIQTFPNTFDVSNAALADLTRKGISPAVMKAMLTAPRTPAAPPVAPRASAPTAAAAPNVPVMPHRAGPYATLELKRLTIAPGVGFPPNGGDPQAYLDAFNQRFLNELVRQKFAANAVPEGANVADAADAYFVEGTITGFRVEHKQVLLSGLDVGVITFQFVFERRSDHAPQGVMTVVVDNLVLGAFTKPDRFASSVSHYLVGEMKKH